MDGELVEATRSYSFHWHKPIGQAQLSAKQLQETLFVSAARCSWAEVLRAYIGAVDWAWPQPRLPVPVAAYDLVFCSWTPS